MLSAVVAVQREKLVERSVAIQHMNYRVLAIVFAREGRDIIIDLGIEDHLEKGQDNLDIEY